MILHQRSRDVSESRLKLLQTGQGGTRACFVTLYYGLNLSVGLAAAAEVPSLYEGQRQRAWRRLEQGPLGAFFPVTWRVHPRREQERCCSTVSNAICKYKQVMSCTTNDQGKLKTEFLLNSTSHIHVYLGQIQIDNISTRTQKFPSEE